MTHTRMPRLVMVGSSNIDLIAYTPRLPAPAETLHGSRFEMGFGGKGANQAVMAAKLGAQVTVVTKLGKDTFGDMTLANYRSLNIDTDHVLFDDERASGVALILVDETSGQNNIVIVGGANDTLSPDDVLGAAQSIQEANALLCQLETPIPATLQAFKLAREAGVTTILNPAPASTLPGELLELTDWLIPNEVEASMLTGGTIRTPEQAESAALALLKSDVKNVVVTLSERGALIADENGVTHVPVAPVKAVDTTGAGDAFVGSFAYLLSANFPPLEAVRRACAIAAYSVQKSGTQKSFPTRAEVSALVE